MRELSGRIAVVTGGASGIGRAICDRLAAEGMSLVLADIEEGPLKLAVDEIVANGGRAIGVRTDVSKLEDVEALAKRTMDEFGSVHVLCNNAGVESGRLFTETPIRTFEWVFGVNFWGVLYGCRTFIPLMRGQDEAHIVNTGSLASFAGGGATVAAYITSKWAVAGLTENLECELRETGDAHIGVSLLVPGPIRTNMNQSERNRPVDVASTADDPVRRGVSEQIDRATAEYGLEPSVAAGLVLDGIKERRFFIMTHPMIAPSQLRQRVEWMETGVAPADRTGVAPLDQ